LRAVPNAIGIDADARTPDGLAAGPFADGKR
jgi:hypothetical protein